MIASISGEMLIVLLVATITALLFERFRLPALLGFILAGTVIGPHGFRWIFELERIRALAELGMIFLMLTIGLEFSFDRLHGLKRVAFTGGMAQLVLSILVSMAAAMAMGWSIDQGFVLGAVIALSSTAVVLRNLMDRGHMDTEHGRLCLAILVFQDLAVGPLLILINAFAGGGLSVSQAILFSLIKAGVLFSVLLVFGRFFLPKILRWITLTRSQEIFMLAIVFLCFGTSWLSAQLGLSASLGAFFAGLMLANTQYHAQISGDILPFRHIFISIFFVSIGLLFDPVFMAANLHMVLPVTGLILFLNIVIVASVIMALGYSPRVAFSVGLILSQIGEFSFLLLESAKHGKLIGDNFYEIILSSAVLSILLTPFLINLVPSVSKMFLKIPSLGLAPKQNQAVQETRKLSQHIILCGYGTSGQDLAAALLLEQVPFVIIEMSPVNIAKARKNNMPVLYGDAMNQAVLQEAAIEQAKAVVISFGDASGLSILIPMIQRLNSHSLIVVRGRYERDIAHLYELGADIVLMEELEVSAELMRIILEHLGRSKEVVENHIQRVRLRKEFLIEQNILRKHN